MEVLISPGKGLLDFLGFSVTACKMFKFFGRGCLVSVDPKICSYELTERKNLLVAFYFSCIRVVFQISTH